MQQRATGHCFNKHLVEFFLKSPMTALVFLFAANAHAAPGLTFEYVEPDAPIEIDALRVCADPNNMPYSNRAEEGFENRIATLIAQELEVPVEYTWWAQRRGFVRNTLAAGKCDVVMGIPTGSDRVTATRPYYRSTYVFLSRKADKLDITSLDDPRLAELKVGVHVVGDDYSNTPGAHALARRGIIDNVVGISIYGDYSQPNPPARLVEAVANGLVDVAIVWGPFAGYFAPKQKEQLVFRAVSPAFDPPAAAFVYSMSIGVKRGDYALRKRISEIIDRRRDDIDRILDEYGVPRVVAGETETRK